MEPGEMILVPVSAILNVLADSVRAADTAEKREALADTLEKIALAYRPFFTA